MAQDGPKYGQEGPKMAQDGFRKERLQSNIEFRSPSASFLKMPLAKSHFLAPLSHPRRPQDGPRWPQDRPKMAQDGPTYGQDGPKMAQDALCKGSPQRNIEFTSPSSRFLRMSRAKSQFWSPWHKPVLAWEREARLSNEKLKIMQERF